MDTKRLLDEEKGGVDQSAVSVEKTDELGHEMRKLKLLFSIHRQIQPDSFMQIFLLVINYQR